MNIDEEIREVDGINFWCGQGKGTVYSTVCGKKN